MYFSQTAVLILVLFPEPFLFRQEYFLISSHGLTFLVLCSNFIVFSVSFIPLCSKMSSFVFFIFAIFLSSVSLYLQFFPPFFFIHCSLSYRCHVSVLHYLSFTHMQGGQPLT